MSSQRFLRSLPLILALSAGAAYALPSLPSPPRPPGLPALPAPPRPVDLGFFFDDLAPHGRWAQQPEYGWVWSPRNVAPDWRPYEEGRWAYTDQGWTWLSDEPFGWATYHYGRWYDDPDLGWSWVPGYEWAPSWVSWQESADYVGWAPLPPRARRASPYSYVFVPDRYFLSSRPARYAVPRHRIWPVYRATRSVRVVPLAHIQRFHRVPRYRVVDAAPGLRFRGPRVERDRIAFYRPAVRHVRVAPPPLRPVARRAVVAGPYARLRDSRPHPLPPAFGARRVVKVSPPPVAPRRIARALPAAPPHRQIRAQRIRPEPRALHRTHPAPRVRHAAPAPRVRAHGRPAPQPRMHSRGAPTRHGRPGRPGRPGPRHHHR